MSYINVYAFFEDPEKIWRKVIVEEKEQDKNTQKRPSDGTKFQTRGLLLK